MTAECVWRGKLLFVVTEDWYFVSHRLQLAIAAKNVGYDVSVVTRVREHGEAIRNAGLATGRVFQARTDPAKMG